MIAGRCVAGRVARSPRWRKNSQAGRQF